jgi:protein-disulfide isomerase
MIKEKMNKLFAVALLSSSMAVMPAFAQNNTEDLVQQHLDRAAIEEIVKNYILENGDVIIEGIDAFQMRQAEEEAKAAEAAIQNESAYLYENNHPVAGNPNASVSVVEFFDYNCGYCKKALADVRDIVDSGEDIRFIFMETPILSPSSMEVSKWSLAADKQGKYFDYHVELMEHRGQYDEKTLIKLAKKAGLDVDQLMADKDAPDVEAQINENLEYMQKFGVRGTPTFIVENRMMRGYVGKERLLDTANEIRESKK